LSDRLLDWALELAVAEENARLKAQQVKVDIPPLKVKPTPTHVVDRRNVVLHGEEVIVQTMGYGVLKEFMCKAESEDFQVLVEKDGETVVFGSYSEYADISQDVEEIEAFPERDADGELTGAYVFKVNDVEFAKNLTVKIITTENVKFRAIFCKYKSSEG
jgi:hypothetical protein